MTPEKESPNSDRPPQGGALRIRVFGVGNAGRQVLRLLTGNGLKAEEVVAVDTSPIEDTAPAKALQLEAKGMRGLGSGGDPERGRSVAEEQASTLKRLCEGVDVVFIVAGFGGGAGTGVSPVLARVAKDAGALVLGFISTPFECEGTRRKGLAQHGLAAFQAAADGVICLSNDKALKLVDENTRVLDAFKLADQLLADGVRGIQRLLTHKGLIDIPVGELCALLREQHNGSVFAVAEAAGATRSRDVLDRLFAHPLLDGGAALGEANAVLVSLLGGPDLTMAEVNRVMQQINAKCDGAQITMGAAIDEQFRERLAVTLIASRGQDPGPAPAEHSRGASAPLSDQFLSRSDSPRAESRFLPPPPSLPADQVQQLFSRQPSGVSRPRKGLQKFRQTQLPLEIISKGRFDKSEPTIHKGEDLDVPTYVRRGVALN